MKKYWVALSALCLLAVACGSNSNSDSAGTQTTSPAAESHESAANDISKDPNYQKGLKLVAQNDCLTCHKVNGQSTGPSYEEVAGKYTNDETTINMLAQKIIDGGSGKWGTVPMTAHPTLKPDDAKQMVKYILLLKKS